MHAIDEELQARLSPILTGNNPPLRVAPLDGDASTRRYFRLFHSDGSTAVVMVQPHAGQNEEASFIDVHTFLEQLDLPVPRVFRHFPDHGLVVLEDLGDRLLEQEVSCAGPARVMKLYEGAVDILIRMRQRTSEVTGGCVAFTLAFDEAKLMEELDFFMTHFIRGLCGLGPSPAAARLLQDFFYSISRLLAAEPRVFAHRDYHSRNLLVKKEKLVMIDFQDARMGPAQYDLASLLRDSYVSVPEDFVERLIARYFDVLDRQVVAFDRFMYVFDVMSLQRNIKALGTFGYQSHVRKSTRYLSSIPRTAAYIEKNIVRYEEFLPFRAVVEEYVSGPGMAMAER